MMPTVIRWSALDDWTKAVVGFAGFAEYREGKRDPKASERAWCLLV